MSWKKYFSPVKTPSPVGSTHSESSSTPGPAHRNYNSFLPDVYAGAANRIERYAQYDTMDMDSEINAALDILAEFCTQKNKENQTPFHLYFKTKATNTEISILREYLQQWSKLQKFGSRIFRVMRNLFKYGDAVFIRDPETLQWNHIDMTKLVKVIVNESEGKKPEQYVIKDIAPNFQTLVATQLQTQQQYVRNTNYTGGSPTTAAQSATSGNTSSRFQLEPNESAIDATHIVHLSLSEGLDPNYPFGTSLLETVYKVYKQKELLEDSIIIYRVQRAPERRAFYIDIGDMAPHLAMSFVERVKNEIQQRRVPTMNGGGTNIIDSAFNPLSITEDYFFPQSASGRGSKVETIAGGCLAMDTKVPLLDGRELTIAELAKEYNDGIENWVYSCDPDTGEMYPGVVSWAGVTQRSAEVMQLLFDNGAVLICTPEHKFPIAGKGLVEARELVIGENMTPHNCDGCELISSVFLSEPIEVGTLTIDQHELVHHFHNFALSIGFFTQNSNLGEVDDLKYFTNKLFRGLRIPSSYLPTGADDSQQQYNDGRVGTAYIQEHRFNQYCERLQSLVQTVFDSEFKMFLNSRGVNIDTSMFELVFEPPQNFSSYRQAELDTQRGPIFSQMLSVPMMSKRFALKRFLGLTDEEIAENERLWSEENGHAKITPTDSSSEMRNVGVSQAGINTDMAASSDLTVPGGEIPSADGTPNAGTAQQAMPAPGGEL